MTLSTVYQQGIQTILCGHIHYADAHQGFYTEFHYAKLNADNITYQKNFPQIEIAEFLASIHDIINPDLLANKQWQALRVMLEKWSYKAEYRYQTSDPSIEKAISNGAAYAQHFYQNDFISSVIFGCRMPEEKKDFIIMHMNYPIKFKQSLKLSDSIEIVDCNKYILFA